MKMKLKFAKIRTIVKVRCKFFFISVFFIGANATLYLTCQQFWLARLLRWHGRIAIVMCRLFLFSIKTATIKFTNYSLNAGCFSAILSAVKHFFLQATRLWNYQNELINKFSQISSYNKFQNSIHQIHGLSRLFFGL